MGKTAALILAAGRSERMQQEVPKQFLLINEKPLFLYSVEAYLDEVDLTVVVTNKDAVKTAEDMLSDDGLKDIVPVIAGGEERYDSSYLGLLYLEKLGGFDTVMIHDAARASITRDVIRSALEMAEHQGTAVAAVPLKDTVKAADEHGKVLETPDRRRLYSVQTPQAFSLPLILEAYMRFYEAKKKDPALSVTDDASVVEQFTDHEVMLTPGSYANVKITTPEDLKLLRP